MADRTTKVTLVAQVSNYIEGMDKAARKTSETVNAAQKLASQKQAFSDVGRSALIFGGVLAAGVGVALAAFADFDAKMSQVKTLSHATGDQMEALSQQALHAGTAIGFSATQTADAEIELVKAGVSVADIMGGALTGALQLAAAGQIDVGQATEIATIALTQFHLAGKDIPHVADLLAAGADKALGGVADLGEALKSGGLVAAQFGVSLDETVGTLSAFANAGLLGETAGTDLRQMLLKLANPAKEASDLMQKLGINLYDSQGKFVGVADLAGQLKSQLGGLSAEQRNSALATIFGARAIAGANVLYNEGADGIAKWTGKVNDSGFAAAQAAGKMDNLKGDLSKLGASFTNDLIESGSGANTILRTMVQNATGLLGAVGQLPAPVLGVGLAVAGAAAGVLLLSGAFLTVIPKIAATRAAMADLNITASTIGKTFGKGGLITLGLIGLEGALSGAGSQAVLTTAQVSKLNAALDTTNLQQLNKEFSDANGNVTTFGNALGSLFTDNFFTSYQGGPAQINGAIKAITFGMVDLGAWADQDKAKFNQLGKQLSETAKTDLGSATGQFNQFVKLAGGGTDKVKQLLSAFPDYKATLIDLASSIGVNLTDQQLLNVAQGKGALAARIAAAGAAQQQAAVSKLAGTAQDASGDISALADQIKNFGKAQFDVDDANRAFQQSIDDVTTGLQSQEDAYKQAHGTMNGFVKTLDIGTQAGRDNSSALENIAKTALNAAGAIVTQTGSQQDATQAISDGRAALITALAQFGITGKAASDYADKLGLIPGNIVTAVNLNKTQAEKDADALMATLNGIQRHIDIQVQMHGAGNLANQAGLRLVSPNADGGMYSYANGGFGAGIYSGGAPMYKFAEKETNWEAFVSGKHGQEARNRQVVSAAAGRLGMSVGTTVYTVNITVPVSNAVVGNESQIAAVTTRAIKNAIRSGALPKDWTNR